MEQLIRVYLETAPYPYVCALQTPLYCDAPQGGPSWEERGDRLAEFVDELFEGTRVVHSEWRPGMYYALPGGAWVCNSCLYHVRPDIWERDLEEGVEDWMAAREADCDAFILALCREAGMRGADHDLLQRWKAAHRDCGCEGVAFTAANQYHAKQEEIDVRRCMGLALIPRYTWDCRETSA